MSNRSRMEGRTPPYPPMMSPFTAKRSATATADFVLARRAVRSCARVVVEEEVMEVVLVFTAVRGRATKQRCLYAQRSAAQEQSPVVKYDCTLLVYDRPHGIIDRLPCG